MKSTGIRHLVGFRNCGLHGHGFSPFILGDDEGRRVHNDERISPLDVAAA
jgi:hypothetical protein